jgi:hypothetical protein
MLFVGQGYITQFLSPPVIGGERGIKDSMYEIYLL